MFRRLASCPWRHDSGVFQAVAFPAAQDDLVVHEWGVFTVSMT